MTFTFLTHLLTRFLFPLLQKLISLEKIAQSLLKIKQMFPGLLFVVWEAGVSCRATELKCLVGCLLLLEEKN